MDAQLLSLVFAAFFCSAFLKGLAGLGFSTICLGLLAIVMDLKAAIPLVFLPSLFSNLMVMVQAGQFMTSLKRFWLLYVSGIPGLLLGVWLLGNYSNTIPKAVLGGTMIIYGLWSLRGEIFRLNAVQERQFSTPIGFISGVINGMTGSQIMPIMPYLLSLKMERKLFIQTINAAFTFNTLIMMLALGKMGLMSVSVLSVSAIGIIPVTVGIFLGGRIQRKVSDDYFRKLVLILFIIIGLSLCIL